MDKTLSGKLFITEGTIDPAIYVGYEKGTLGYQIMGDNITRLTRTDFNTTFTETNTGTLYKATESIAGNTPKDVYYFAGDAKNNWVKFGKYQNDLIRYRGYYSTTSIAFEEYSTMDECTSASSYNTNCTEYKYANTGDDIYWRIIRTNYDGSIRLLYSGTSPDITSGYIGTSAFNTKDNDPMYVGYMYGTSGSLNNNRSNTNSSAIKSVIDNWYSLNLNNNYGKYISTTAVYCNDRSLESGNTFSNSSNFNYAPMNRLVTNKAPSYDCTNNSDKFTVDSSTGNGKLTYPIALMTADELAYAGGVALANNQTTYYYYNSNKESSVSYLMWWTMTPYRWSSDGFAFIYFVTGSSFPGKFGSNVLGDSSRVVRPVLSLKGCTIYSSGDGSSSNPYIIEETSTGC